LVARGALVAKRDSRLVRYWAKNSPLAVKPT
jgi:hypothetical protein